MAHDHYCGDDAGGLRLDRRALGGHSDIAPMSPPVSNSPNGDEPGVKLRKANRANGNEIIKIFHLETSQIICQMWHTDTAGCGGRGATLCWGTFIIN
jgi:hypothetical protein